MPGTISNGTPAAWRAATSSPPRAKTNGSPPLSRTTVLPRLPPLHQQGVDLRLGQAGPAGGLPDADPLGAGRRQVEEAGHRQPVVDHDVGPGQHLGSPHGDQPGVAGTGPDEIDGHGGEDGTSTHLGMCPPWPKRTGSGRRRSRESSSRSSSRRPPPRRPDVGRSSTPGAPTTTAIHNGDARHAPRRRPAREESPVVPRQGRHQAPVPQAGGRRPAPLRRRRRQPARRLLHAAGLPVDLPAAPGRAGRRWDSCRFTRRHRGPGRATWPAGSSTSSASRVRAPR